jgi:hypothetical protein
MRWSEEVFLLVEEMRRVCEFFAWQAHWWRDMAVHPDGLTAIALDGMRAYALRQAALREALLQDCLQRWKSVPALFNSSPRHSEVSGISPQQPALWFSPPA